ncbi:MAG: hypothetical protein AAGF11_15900 [Myxococcota bacterium]
MATYDLYELHQRRGQHAEASRALHESLRLEIEAAKGAPRNLEPTRSVLFRSAASIALEAGQPAQARHLIAEGLRGQPPAPIKEELIDLLDQHSYVHDELADPARLLSPGTVVQQIAIRHSAPTRTAIAMSAISEIQDIWVRCFTPLLGSGDKPGDKKSELGPPRQLEPVHAAVGSFALQLKVSGELAPSERQHLLGSLDQLGDLTREGIDRAKLSIETLDRLRELTSLLDILYRERVRLDVEMFVVGEDERRVHATFAPTSPELLRRLQQLLSDHVVSADIPQANDIDKVFDLVTQLRATGELPAPESLGIVARQVNYYRRAAEILGYLRDGVLTPATSLIATASRDVRLRHALSRFEASEVGNAWLRWAECSRLHDVDPTSAERFLLEISVGLSPATIKRRAKTLRAWHSAFEAVFE